LTKKKTSVSLDTELLAWIEKKIKEKKFASVSHAVEYALEKLRKTES
jgi:Arc/MetJ-type ribon-helix-helix transcriptional regulator